MVSFCLLLVNVFVLFYFWYIKNYEVNINEICYNGLKCVLKFVFYIKYMYIIKDIDIGNMIKVCVLVYMKDVNILYFILNIKFKK